jgi:nuclear cap-binding protein subunit 2
MDDLPAVEKAKKLATSSTLYVGNLTFYTTEEQLWELFSKVGEISRIIMGLNLESKQQCGFCFVEYTTHKEAANCMRFINGTKLDDRIIRIDWDPGFVEGREYGRGMGGNQRRDQFRKDFDPGRGGYGLAAQMELMKKRQREQEREERFKNKKQKTDETSNVKKETGNEEKESTAEGGSMDVEKKLELDSDVVVVDAHDEPKADVKEEESDGEDWDQIAERDQQ